MRCRGEQSITVAHRFPGDRQGGRASDVRARLLPGARACGPPGSAADNAAARHSETHCTAIGKPPILRSNGLDWTVRIDRVTAKIEESMIPALRAAWPARRPPQS